MLSSNVVTNKRNLVFAMASLPDISLIISNITDSLYKQEGPDFKHEKKAPLVGARLMI